MTEEIKDLEMIIREELEAIKKLIREGLGIEDEKNYKSKEVKY